jgi:hypothetical protein
MTIQMCGTNAGHARAFTYNSTLNKWVQVGSDIDGEATDDRSGRSVAISADGKTIAIAAFFNDNVNGTDAGHLRVNIQ